MNYLQIEQEHEESFRRKILKEEEQKNKSRESKLLERIRQLEAENKALRISLVSKYGNEK